MKDGKTYIIGIGDDANNLLNKIKENYNDITTILFYDGYYHEKLSKNIDIGIKYDYLYNNSTTLNYKTISSNLLDSVKEEIDNLSNKINKNDKVILFNNFIFTGSLEIFYYLCKMLGSKCNNCYILFCNGYSFLGQARKDYNEEIIDKIYELNYKIYELDGTEVVKIKQAKNVSDKIKVVYDEFYNYIEKFIKSEMI